MSNIQALRIAKVITALDALELSSHHARIITQENPSASLPYHNSGHCCTVALNCLEGARVSGLDRESTRLLFLAGLYHDYAHTGGKSSDEVNISRAVEGVIRWCNHLEEFSGNELDRISENIVATIYPGSLFAGSRNLSQAIICDADHMQYLEPDASSFIEGLMLESGRPNDSISTCAFLASYEPHTEWGRGKLEIFREAHSIGYGIRP